ncbi:MAG: hypothetical protein NTW82_13385 [Bacteroidia bacterium]|nr:hypothetical protein [Bacteroidia bacterium]
MSEYKRSINMASWIKIKIKDNIILRAEIEKLILSIDQADLAKWALRCAEHVIKFSEQEFPANEAVTDGFRTTELWLKGNATVHQIRQAGFKIHAVARQCKTEVAKAAIRTAGQAVGTGHMKEHAIICSDYAIKTIQLAFPGDLDKITAEREWQLNELKRFLLQK